MKSNKVRPVWADTPKNRKRIGEMLAKGMTVEQIGGEFGVSRRRIAPLVKAVREERAKLPYVWILNGWEPDFSSFDFLGYGDGSPRVYVKDDYDPRLRPLYPRLPYAEDYEGAIRHFFKNGKPRKGAKPIQVNVEALSEFGFDENMINSIDEDIEAHRTAA